MNREADFLWLRHGETMDEIKEESVEIKEEPFDDMADIRQEDYFNNCSDYASDKIERIKDESFQDFADIKQDEPILDAFDVIENVSMEIKEEDPIDDFVDIKEEELSAWPIADIFCPSTGNSRPLTIDLEEGMHSRSQRVHRRPTIMNLTKTITGKRKMKKCDYCDGHYTKGAGMEMHVRLRHPEELKRRLTKCSFCDSLYKIGGGMDYHVRWEHPEALKMMLKKCDYCDGLYSAGNGMANHLRSTHLKEFEETRKLKMLKKCNFCDSSLSVGIDMANHVLSMHPQRKCDFCRSFHAVGASMDEHVRSMHPKRKCVYCPSFHVIGASMVQHVRSMHPERLFQDPLKRYSSSNSHNLAMTRLLPKARIMPTSALEQNLQPTAKCDFCGEETHSFLVSPDNLDSARRFFNKLELTQAQRASTVRFFQKNLRAIVCRKHLFAEYPLEWKPETI